MSTTIHTYGRCAIELRDSGYTISVSSRPILRQPFDPDTAPPSPFASNSQALMHAASEALGAGLLDESSLEAVLVQVQAMAEAEAMAALEAEMLADMIEAEAEATTAGAGGAVEPDPTPEPAPAQGA